MRRLLTLCVAAALSACSQAPVWHTQTEQPQRTTTHVLAEQSTTQDYSRLLAQQLLNSARGITSNQRVAVTSPVWLDSEFNYSPPIGRQLQEEIGAELHRLSLHVVDYKLTDAIRVTQDGDFALSKNYLELRELQPADYILAGTMLEQDNGIIVNARLIDFHTQVIRATAQVTLPSHLVERLRAGHGVEIVSSER